MSAADDILNQIPFDQLAAKLGVDTQTAEATARQALPALLLGLKANTQDPAGEKSLEGALAKHDDDLLSGNVNLDAVDTADGEKIVANVFGAKQDQVVQQLSGVQALAGAGGAGGGALVKALPLLAPLVMTFLAKNMRGGGSGAQSQATTSGGDGGGVGALLSSLIGGGGGAGPSGGGGGIADLLSGLLGGGRR